MMFGGVLLGTGLHTAASGVDWPGQHRSPTFSIRWFGTWLFHTDQHSASTHPDHSRLLDTLIQPPTSSGHGPQVARTGTGGTLPAWARG